MCTYYENTTSETWTLAKVSQIRECIIGYHQVGFSIEQAYKMTRRSSCAGWRVWEIIDIEFGI